MILADVLAYMFGRDGLCIKCGHIFFPSHNLIPVLTPNALASYEEVMIQDPYFPFVTAMGMP